jgi:hypothetical protein
MNGELAISHTDHTPRRFKLPRLNKDLGVPQRLRSSTAQVTVQNLGGFQHWKS